MSSYATPIPGASGYEQGNLLARRAYDNAMSRYQQRRSQSLLHYGYTKNAQGQLGVDPNNEYGAYQQMLRGENTQSHHLDALQHASGWGGGSGFLGATQDALQHAQGGEQANLGTSLTNELSNIDQGETDAAYTRDQALYQNELDAARNAINQGNFNPADYTGLNPADYGEPTTPPAATPSTPKPKPPGGSQNVHRAAKARLIQQTRARLARARGGRR